MSPKSTEAVVRSIVSEYPPSIREGQMSVVKRFAFEAGLAMSRSNSEHPRICDIGGGWGTFALTCAALGARVTLLDDFLDSGFFDQETFAAVRRLHETYGVESVERDIVREGFGFPDDSLDVVTSFESFEHWHHSPKKSLASVMRALKPEGTLIISAPNCVNLRKRITVPFGRGKWSSMEEWYETDVFRGHVREPDVDDLRYVARDLNLRKVEILGRNWFGYYNDSRLVRWVTPLVDRVLTFRPSLCSNIYLVGRRPPR